MTTGISAGDDRELVRPASALIRGGLLVDLASSEPRVAREPGTPRERRVFAASAVAFLLVSAVLPAATSSVRPLSLALVALLVVAYAVASLVEFGVGGGAAVPTQVLLVPMLFVLPLGYVPLVAASGFVVGGLLCRLLRLRACGNSLVMVASSWYSLGPTLVLLAAGEAAPAASRWPLYLLAFGAQFLLDTVTTSITDVLLSGARPVLILRRMASVYLIDVLLAPIGLVFASVAVSAPFVIVLVLPLLVLMVLFARDRREHIAGLKELGETYRGTAVVLGDVIEADDGYTGEHSRSVQELCLAVADRMGLDAMRRREVEFAALLHDVGKLRIPNEIITKPGPLTPEERAVINTHPAEGERLLARAGGFLAEVGRLVRSCHERFDGEGYPDRLAGEEIPLAARIVACCDAYNAMTSNRSYREAMPSTVALAEVRSCAGSQFDPLVVEALSAVLEAAASHDGLRPAARLTDRRATEARDVSRVERVLRERISVERLRARAAIGPAISAYLPGGLFALVALALPTAVGLTFSWSLVATTLVLVAVYAVAYGIDFKIGPGAAVPTQLVFVPMLVLLPPVVVPLAVGLAILARSGWDRNACGCPPRQRPFVLLAGAWYTIGPVAVLLVTARPLTLPLLAAGLFTQIVIDALVNVIRVGVGLGYPIGSLLRNLGWAYVADVALTPAAFLTVAPGDVGRAVTVAAIAGPLAFLALVAADRQRHLQQVTGLADAYREAADRARRDALTGLTNRLGWDEAVAAIDADRAAAVILLDVNGLKHANDTRGHQFGDEILVEVAATLLRGLPHASVVARLGGDEFGVLLVGDSAHTKEYSARRLRSVFATHPGLDGQPVSAAVGYAATEPGIDIQAALAAADEMLYADKPGSPRPASGARRAG